MWGVKMPIGPTHTKGGNIPQRQTLKITPTAGEPAFRFPNRNANKMPLEKTVQACQGIMSEEKVNNID